MNEWTNLDRMRAWAEGTLGANERARFEGEMAADSELARRALELRAIWDATHPIAHFDAASRTSFDELMRTAESEAEALHRRRRAAALILLVPAAAAALVVGWRSWAGHSAHEPARLVLRAIPLDARGPSAPAAALVPGFLASWSPVQGDSIRWLSSMQDARAAAAAVERPIFVYGYIPGCPLCRQLDTTTFKDPEIAALVERSVPVAIDLSKLAPEELEAIYERRYPLLEIQDAQGAIVHTFAGTFLDVDVRAELDGSLQTSRPADWTLVRDLAGGLAEARAGEARGDLAVAERGFQHLATRADLPALESEGQAGLRRVGEAARAVLDSARARAGEPGALAALEKDAQPFAGTSFEPDLKAVLESWRATGRFPALDAASTATH